MSPKRRRASIKISANNEESYLVPAVEKAVRIFELFKKYDELSLTEISNKLNLPKSSVFRILKTLQHFNYLEHSNNLYSLGANMIDLIVIERKHQNLLSVASPLMGKLTNEVNETTKLGIVKNDKLMIINRIVSKSSYNVTTEVGNEFPMHAGAASKLLLAHLSKSHIDKILSEPLKKYTENTVTDKNKLIEDLRKIREQGFAIDNEEYLIGIKAIACPILNYNRQVIAALSIPYLATNNDKKKFEYLLHNLLVYSNHISKALGYRKPEKQE